MRWGALLACAGGVVLAPACGLALGGLGAVGPDGSTGGGDDAGGDAMPEETGGGDDASPEADSPATNEAAASSVAITPVGAITQPTGLAQQTHLVYATHSARWWLFWIEAAQPYQLQASSSPDFVTWSPATPLTLPASHDEQGGDFSVAYADIAGVDVVHITMGLHFPAANDLRHFHGRATLSGAAIAYDPPVQVTMVNDMQLVPPDGPATLVTADHRVWDSSGWANYMGTGNEVAWVSSGFDNGTSWDGMLGIQQNLAAEAHTVNARAFGIAGGNALVALWELADQEPDPTNVAWSRNDVVLGWGPPAKLFLSNAQSANDWDVVRVSANDLRVIRRALDGSFDHVRYDGVTWTTMAVPLADTGYPGLAESGVVLLTDAGRVALVTIASDAAGTVRMTVWDGSAWSPWSTLEGSAGARRYLSAWSSPGHSAVLWTQGSGPDLTIVGKLVAF